MLILKVTKRKEGEILGKKVILSIVSRQSDGNQQEKIEVKTEGEYFFQNGKHFVLYEEIEENSNQKIKTRMKFTNTSMEMTKTGAIDTRMTFEEKKEYQVEYYTFIGRLFLGLYTKRYEMVEKANGFCLSTSYQLEMDASYKTDCEIEIGIEFID